MTVVIFQYIVASYAFRLAGVLITFGVGAFLLVLAILNEIKDNLKRINDLAKFERNRSKTLNFIGDSIQVHGRLMQLSDYFLKVRQIFQITLIFNSQTNQLLQCTLLRFIHEFLEVYQPVFMLLAVSSLVLICGVLLVIQIEIVQ